MNKIVKNQVLSSNEMMKYILNLINSFKDNELKDLCNLFITEYGREFEYHPAGIGHHTYTSGLLSHTYNMLRQGESISDIYSLNKDLLLTAILLHDCGKVVTTDYNKDKEEFKLNPEYVLLQHLTQGVLIIERLALNTNMSKDKMLLLQHMIASHHGRPEWGSYTYPAFPEAEALHHLDNMDARLDVMFDKLGEMDENTSLSDRVSSLNDRILYKHIF